MNKNDLEMLARDLVAPGKGILAADESFPTIEKRFKAIGLPSTEDARRAYREMLFTTPDLSKFISGVILFDETIRQKASDGTPFVEVLNRQGIIPGIKVDKGTVELANFPGEKVTEGLDGLRKRLEEYRQLGARFAKWRAVIRIDPGLPTVTALRSNADAMARYATLCHEFDMLPIVEPEVLMDGEHTIAECYEVTEITQNILFEALFQHGVAYEHLLLKANMVIAGKDCPQQSAPEEVAQLTLSCLRRTVPAAVPGIVFLSGGQGPEQATQNLDEINRQSTGPWELTFSYGRALQDPPLRTWRGNAENLHAAQEALRLRAELNSAARNGTYAVEMETKLAEPVLV